MKGKILQWIFRIVITAVGIFLIYKSYTFVSGILETAKQWMDSGN